jgi:ParB-like chromosome segregation protein Spo0J
MMMQIADVLGMVVLDLDALRRSPNHAAHIRRLAADIAVNGLREPLETVTYCGRTMLGEGHHRLLAVESLGWTEVEVSAR